MLQFWEKTGPNLDLDPGNFRRGRGTVYIIVFSAFLVYTSALILWTNTY